MWVRKKDLEEFIAKYLSQFAANASSLLEKCFNVDNDGNIDVTNSNFNLYIGSTVTKGADETEIAEIKSLVSGLYGVLAERSAEELRQFGFFKEALDRTDAKLEQLRAELLDGVHAVLECQERVLQDVKKELTDAFAEHDRQTLLTARANLYDVMHKMWTGEKDENYFENVYHYSGQIKNIVRNDDIVAAFCRVFFAPQLNSNGVNRFLTEKSPQTQDDARFVLRTILLRYNKKYKDSIASWINAISDPEKSFFRARYEQEAEKFDKGEYDLTRSRAVFVAYDHEDYNKALELVEELERPEYGLECFFAARNLQLTPTFGKDLEKAMDHCRVFVLVSTTRSRAGTCYADKEMDYIRFLDTVRAKVASNVPYKDIPLKCRTPRVEYRPDCGDVDYGIGFGEKVKEFFSGSTMRDDLTYYADIADVCNRIFSIVNKNQWAVETGGMMGLERPTEAYDFASTLTPETPQPKAVKYCAGCGAECAITVQFCPNCGGNLFRPKKDAKYCKECGAEVHSSVTFCTECGADTFEGSPVDPTPADLYRSGCNNYNSKDFQRAAFFFRKAAEMGHTEAQYMLGNCYDHGTGIEESKKDAFVWYDKAAEKGHVKAQFSAGWFYCFGKKYGIDVDEEKGRKYLEHSEQKGYVPAQYALGYYYEHGKVVERSVEKALEWYEKAAENGYDKAKERADALKKQIEEEAAKREADAERKRKAAEAERVRRLSTLVRRGGEGVLFFGSYPQTRVTDHHSLMAALNAAAGALPTKKNAAKWTSYKYFIKGKNDKDFMWYIDLEYSGEKYRGVYFTSYRPSWTSDSSSADKSLQDNNGYTTGNVYWFKYEPIKWRILSEANGEALILSEMIIDSQEYCSSAGWFSFSHNGGTGHANNYALSDIRKWLNDTFYHTAFTDLQKQLIVPTTVDNSARSTNPNNHATEWNLGNNRYACANTQDHVFLLSEQEVTNSAYGFDSTYSNNDTARQKKNTDYAKSQGVHTDWFYAGNGDWWLRSPYYNGSYNARYVKYDGDANKDYTVGSTTDGVVPALRIRTGTATKEDNGPIQEGNDAKARSLKREIGVSKGIETGGVKAGEDAHRGAKQRRRGNKKIVLFVIAILVIISIVGVTITIAAFKGSAGSKTGDELYFGSYPQTVVTDSSITSALTTAAGTLPTSSNSRAWTSYGYYINGSVSNYMWYIDVEQGGEKYRGVYFTSYRPYYTSHSSSAIQSHQDDNGYTTGNVYWFKYEPIKWRILSEANGEALILSEMIIDSQEYYPSSRSSSFSHNGGTGYANNYALSDIRKWLNDTFYNTAFSDVQKQIILLTTVDNSARSTNPNNDATAFNGGTNEYACENTEDCVFLLSEQEVTNTAYGFNADANDDIARQKKNTDYAQSQGVWISTASDYAGNGYWWLRSPNDDHSYSALSVYGSGGNYGGFVFDTGYGVVPALKIKLS